MESLSTMIAYIIRTLFHRSLYLNNLLMFVLLNVVNMRLFCFNCVCWLVRMLIFINVDFYDECCFKFKSALGIRIGAHFIAASDLAFM